MKKEWKLANPNIEYSTGEDIIGKILEIRGIEDRDDFINPSENLIHSPFELKNMAEVVDKIMSVIMENKKVVIYGDIDSDGITSLVTMYKYLKLQGCENVSYLSNQREEGHGVITSKVEACDLLIIVDSSTNSVGECKELSASMDIIILDHHDSDVKNPYATIVNPQLCDYHNKALSGSAVTWLTCRAVDEVIGTDYAEELVDIATVGIIADMMDLSSLETRAIVNKGLRKMHDNPDFNLGTLLKELKKNYKPNAQTIGFYIAPFFNSIIRLSDIYKAIDIMLLEDSKEVKALIKQYGKKNEKRKEIQAETVDEIENKIDLSHSMIIINSTELDIPSGMQGLIANDIAQKYQKPTICVKFDAETSTYGGSARGYGKMDFKDILSCTGLFEYTQGHSNSFGVEINMDNFDFLYDEVDRIMKDYKQEIEIPVDLIIDYSDVDLDMLYDIMRLSFICGQGFREPIFLIENLPIDEVNTMKDVHLKIKSDDMEFVKFYVSPEEIKNAKESMFMDCVGAMEVNSFYHFGKKETIRTKQMRITDYELY